MIARVKIPQISGMPTYLGSNYLQRLQSLFPHPLDVKEQFANFKLL